MHQLLNLVKMQILLCWCSDKSVLYVGIVWRQLEFAFFVRWLMQKVVTISSKSFGKTALLCVGTIVGFVALFAIVFAALL